VEHSAYRCPRNPSTPAKRAAFDLRLQLLLLPISRTESQEHSGGPLDFPSYSPRSTATMGFFTNPTSFRNANFLSNLRLDRKNLASSSQSMFTVLKNQPLPPHTSHPDFAHLILLVFEAVLEVVCVSLPGYIVARQGMFDAEAQKFVANLNVALFTPCLSRSCHGAILVARCAVSLIVTQSSTSSLLN
jgi:hypothetical protein